MFTAFEDNPLISPPLWHRKGDPQRRSRMAATLPTLPSQLPGARQIFDLTVDLVQTSCGMAVPIYEYVGEREQLNAWATKKGEEGVEAYWKETNHVKPVDGKRAKTRFA